MLTISINASKTKKYREKSLRTYLIALVLFVTGCSTNTTFQVVGTPSEMPGVQPLKKGFEFDISVEDGPSSKFTKNFPKGFCGLSFGVRVTKVYPNGEWNPYSKISFSNSDYSKRFDIIFYYDRSQSKITPLIMFSDVGTAEPLGNAFDLNEEIDVIVYREQGELGISVEPASKLKNILSPNNSKVRTETIEFAYVDIDFIPVNTTFLGVSSDSFFEHIDFKKNCRNQLNLTSVLAD